MALRRFLGGTARRRLVRRLESGDVLQDVRLAGNVKSVADPGPEQTPFDGTDLKRVGVDRKAGLTQAIKILAKFQESTAHLTLPSESGELAIEPVQEIIDDFRIVHGDRDVNRRLERGDHQTDQQDFVPAEKAAPTGTVEIPQRLAQRVRQAEVE